MAWITLFSARKRQQVLCGFTLAELLIALAILGVIATFSIPKIISAQKNGQSAAKAKEVAGMIAGAYKQAQLANAVTASMKPSDLTPYMNYVAIDTSTPIDFAGRLSNPSERCNTYASGYPCIRLHNGGLLVMEDTCTFSGTSSINFIQFRFDPDGQRAGQDGVDGPSKAVWFDLYYDGFLTTRDKQKTGSTCSSGTYGPTSGYDPSWFTW